MNHRKRLNSQRTLGSGLSLVQIAKSRVPAVSKERPIYLRCERSRLEKPARNMAGLVLFVHGVVCRGGLVGGAILLGG